MMMPTHELSGPLVQYFKTSLWPMLLILAEANAFNTSGAYNGGRPSPNGAGGLRPPAPFGEFIICSASIKSIGLR